MNTTKTPPHDGDVEPWYPIGTPGVPWTEAQREQWRASVEAPKRSYADEVLAKLEPLKSRYDVFKYGALPYDADDPEAVPAPRRAHAVRPVERQAVRPRHRRGPRLRDQRGAGRDPVPGDQVRGFRGRLQRARRAVRLAVGVRTRPAMERARGRPQSILRRSTRRRSKFLGALVDAQGVGTWMVHVDLHETTDTDETEFRPARRRGTASTSPRTSSPMASTPWATRKTRNPTFSATSSTRCPVTHIAPSVDGKIIGEPVTQPGVINYPVRELGLCASVTNARYVTTTEVYPDSPKCTDDQCNDAQVAAVAAALTHVKRGEDLSRFGTNET